MIESIGASCITIAVILDIASYYKQVLKTLNTKKSRHVSTSALMLRIVKDMFVLVALGIYANWQGFGIHVLSLTACSITLYVVAQHKPKGWKLFNAKSNH